MTPMTPAERAAHDHGIARNEAIRDVLAERARRVFEAFASLKEDQ